MITVILYNPNSKGGNYDYSLRVSAAYEKHSAVSKCIVLYPANAKDTHSTDHYRLLLADESGFQNKWLKRIYFLYRTFVNPLILFRFIKRYPDSSIIFNDFDQLSSFLWYPLFKIFRKGHIFSVILHDPDRDDYLISRKLSALSMHYVMKLMQVGFYHEVLPDKSYYKKLSTQYVNTPHGIYSAVKPDPVFVTELKAKQGVGRRVVSVIGNIRAEKNYDIIIEALKDTGICLLVAGKPANSNVPLQAYQQKALSLGVDVIWITRYLTEAELAAAIDVSDCVLLYYARSFTSQSGVLNIIAPFKKDVIIGDTPSALKEVANRFGIGRLIPSDNINALHKALMELPSSQAIHAWDSYMAYASWENNADIVVKALNDARQS